MQRKLNPGLRHRVRNAFDASLREIVVHIRTDDAARRASSLLALGIDATVEPDGSVRAVLSANDLRHIADEPWVHAVRGELSHRTSKK